MSLIVGIDLGTTNSLIGAMDAGFPVLLADAEGERLTPSVVHFPESGEPLVGRPAARMRSLGPGAHGLFGEALHRTPGGGGGG